MIPKKHRREDGLLNMGAAPLPLAAGCPPPSWRSTGAKSRVGRCFPIVATENAGAGAGAGSGSSDKRQRRGTSASGSQWKARGRQG